MKFGSARIAVIFAWYGNFDCLIGSNPMEQGSGGGTPGNISADLAAAMNIKIWLERAAYKAGLESIHLILLSELPRANPVELLPWQQGRVDKAMGMLEDKLRDVGWLEEVLIPYHEIRT